MKKRLLAVMIVCAMAAFAGCSQDTEPVQESAGQISIEESSEISAESSEEGSVSAQPSEEESSKDESSKAQESSKAEESSKTESNTSKTETSKKESSSQSSAPATRQVIVQQPQTQTTTTTEPQPQDNEPQPQQPQTEQPSQQTPQPQPEPSQQPQSGSISKADLAISVNGQSVGIMTEMNSVASVFGTASSVESLPSCLGQSQADDKLYHYNGYTIQTLNDGIEKIYYITIEGDGASTSKGIKIGSSTDDVKAAYGEPSAQEEWMYTYDVDNGKFSLQLMITDGAVSEIIISADVM